MTAPRPTKEVPFTFTLPTVLDARANGDWPPDQMDAAAAQVAGREGLATVHGAAQRLINDPHLSEYGKRDAYTRAVLPVVTQLNEHELKLAAAEQALVAREAALDAPKPGEPVSQAQLDRRLAIATRCGTLSLAERSQWVEEALTGRDPAKRDALANEEPALTGIAPQQRERLREILNRNPATEAERERLASERELVRRVRQSFAARRDAIVASADLDVLYAAKAVGLRRSLLKTDAAKSAYIKQHGLAAFQALPA